MHTVVQFNVVKWSIYIYLFCFLLLLLFWLKIIRRLTYFGMWRGMATFGTIGRRITFIVARHAEYYSSTVTYANHSTWSAINFIAPHVSANNCSQSLIRISATNNRASRIDLCHTVRRLHKLCSIDWKSTFNGICRS